MSVSGVMKDILYEAGGPMWNSIDYKEIDPFKIPKVSVKETG